MATARAALLGWFAEQAADLPWRRQRTPYRIWLAEVMLMQTRVATVLRYYERFLAAFPTLAALADAPLDTVLKQWEGLGYYARARNLQRTARLIQGQYGGAIPRQYDQLLALPGIGPYSAAAIASIAFGEATGRRRWQCAARARPVARSRWRYPQRRNATPPRARRSGLA